MNANSDNYTKYVNVGKIQSLWKCSRWFMVHGSWLTNCMQGNGKTP